MKIELDIDNFIKNFKNSCSKVQTKTYSKGEIITTYLVNRNQICILLDGSADLIRYNSNGTQNIIEHLSNNDLFGEIFYQIHTNNELFVIAKKKCEVLFFSYEFFNKKCKKNCKFHDTLISTLPNLVLTKIVDLNVRIELLSKRSIREKLLSYFSILSSRNITKNFSLPLSFTDLADYLSVDRSAMMREIKYLKEDGIIEKNGNKIKLLI